MDYIYPTKKHTGTRKKRRNYGRTDRQTDRDGWMHGPKRNHYLLLKLSFHGCEPLASFPLASCAWLRVAAVQRNEEDLGKMRYTISN